MKINKIFLIAFILFSLILNGKVRIIKKMPSDFILPTEELEITEIKSQSTTDLWIVYSDRNDNYTFKEPNSYDIKKKCDFLEKFYVIDETEKYVHIIKDEPGYSEVSTKKAKDYGWIRKDHLLLWNHCLVNDNNINRKVIFSNSVINLLASNYSINEDLGNITFYTNPYLNNANHNESEFNIFYIFKRYGDNILISNEPKIYNDKDVKSKILGWISSFRILSWDTGYAIEPNWDIDAANERISNNIKTSILISEPQAREFQSGKKSTNLLCFLENDSYTNRKPGNWFRFPVINFEDGIFECQLIGFLNNDLKNNILNSKKEILFDILSKNTIDYLENMFKNEDLYKIYNSNNPLSINGFTPYYINEFSYPLYKLVLLLDNNEISFLLKVLEKFQDYENDRNSIYLAWLEVLSQNWGNHNYENYDDLSLNYLHNFFFKVTNNEDKLNNFKLIDIIDEQILPDSLFISYTQEISKSYNELSDIFYNDDFKYKFSFNNVTYYWIDMEILPIIRS